MPPQFSIITPSFRQLDWLRLCLASVADQQGVNVEHIVQDGGTSGIEEFFQKKQDQWHRHAKLFVEKDAGMYDAINRGLQRASGEICAYLNCDEQYLPNTLSTVTGFFSKQPETEVLFGDAILINEKGEPLSYRRTILPALKHTQLVHLNTLSCAMFFRRSVMERGFFFDSKWQALGDVIWVEQLIRAGVQMAVLPRPLSVFTFTGANRGESVVAKAERASKERAAGRLGQINKAIAILHHRVRKLCAGAYIKRKVEIAIYTRDSPAMRRNFVSDNVGFGWPR